MSCMLRWTAVIITTSFTLGIGCLPDDFWVALNGEVVNGAIINWLNGLVVTDPGPV